MSQATWPGVRHDLQIRQFGDEALFDFVEVAGVGEGQRLSRRVQHLDGECRRRLALGMEVAGQRFRGLAGLPPASCEEVAGNREGRARRRQPPRNCRRGREGDSGVGGVFMGVAFLGFSEGVPLGPAGASDPRFQPYTGTASLIGQFLR